MVLVVCLVQVFTCAVNILTDPTSTNQFGLLSLTTLKNDVNRTEDEKHLKTNHWKKMSTQTKLLSEAEFLISFVEPYINNSVQV